MNRRAISALCCSCLASAACSGVPGPQFLSYLEAGPQPGAAAIASPELDASGAMRSPPSPDTDASASVGATPEAAADDAATSVARGVAEAAAPADAARGGGDAGPADANPPAFTCGATSCAFGAQTCCVQSGGFQMTSTTCVAGTTCPANATFALRCTASTDCPAPQVCCLSQLPTAVSQCRAQCAGGRELCDPAAAVTSCTMRCMPSGGGMGAVGRLPPNVGVCQ